MIPKGIAKKVFEIFFELFWSIYSPMGTKIEIRRKKRVPGRILKNGLVQSIPETLENVNTVGA